MIQLIIWIKRDIFCDNWRWSSGHKLWLKCFYLSSTKLVFRFQAPRLRYCFKLWKLFWIYLMIFDKARSSLWKIKLGFWTCGLMRLLGPNYQKLVSRPHTPDVTVLGIKSWRFCNKIYNQKVNYLIDSCYNADKKI